MRAKIILLALVLAAVSVFSCHAESPADPASFNAGDIVIFGRYEQDCNNDNGPEEIEWLVLENRDGALLLISRYILDARQYFYFSNSPYDWEHSRMRDWLNFDFMDDAFTQEEQGAILLSDVENGGNGETGGDGEDGEAGLPRNTADQVFLLSVSEATEICFPEPESRICAMTDLATFNYFNKYDKSAGPWLTRTPDPEDPNHVITIDENGRQTSRNSGDTLGVRPVIRLDMTQAEISGSHIRSVAPPAYRPVETIVNRLYARVRRYSDSGWLSNPTGKVIIAIYDSDVSDTPQIITSETEYEYTFPREYLADSVDNADYVVIVYPEYILVGNYGYTGGYKTVTKVCMIDPHYKGNRYEIHTVDADMPPERITTASEGYGQLFVQKALDYAVGNLGE